MPSVLVAALLPVALLEISVPLGLELSTPLTLTSLSETVSLILEAGLSEVASGRENANLGYSHDRGLS